MKTEESWKMLFGVLGFGHGGRRTWQFEGARDNVKPTPARDYAR